MHRVRPLALILLILLAGLLVLAPEFVFIRDNFGNRMNTVFKFYYQGWVLLSVIIATGVLFKVTMICLVVVVALVAFMRLPLRLATALIAPAAVAMISVAPNAGVIPHRHLAVGTWP